MFSASNFLFIIEAWNLSWQIVKGTFPDSEEWIRGDFELAPSTSEAVALSEKMMMMMKMKHNKIEFFKSNFFACVNLLSFGLGPRTPSSYQVSHRQNVHGALEKK